MVAKDVPLYRFKVQGSGFKVRFTVHGPVPGSEFGEPLNAKPNPEP
jgi:hypothetical protein